MLSQDTLEVLMRSEQSLRGPALSVYLDVDQSKPRNRNREFEATLRGLLRPVERKTSPAGNRNFSYSVATPPVRHPS